MKSLVLFLEELTARGPTDKGDRSGLLLIVATEGSAVAPRTLTENWDMQALFAPPAPAPAPSYVPARNSKLKVQASPEFRPPEHYWYCTVPIVEIL